MGLEYGLPLEAGIYPDLPEAEYHADPCPEPSLSSSIAKRLVTQSPRHAWAAHPRLNPHFEPETDKRFDFGSAAHMILLGAGPQLEILPFNDYKKGAAREARDAAYEAGKTPILEDQYSRAMDMVTAARVQLSQYEAMRWALSDDAPGGMSEVTLIWQLANAWCRARIDRLVRYEGRVVQVDYKTSAESAHPQALARRIYNQGADVQQSFYRLGLQHVGVTDRIESYIIVQENTPPYELSVATLGPEAMRRADEQRDIAIALWQRCMAEDEWPGYPKMPVEIENEQWAENRWLELRDELRADLDPPKGLTVINAG